MIVFLKIIIIRAIYISNILIKTSKDGLIKKLDYIFKLSKFKLKYDKDKIVVVINNKIIYILIINNINYNILVIYYQPLNRAIIFNIKKYYYILFKDKDLANKSILIKKEFIIAIVIFIILIL